MNAGPCLICQRPNSPLRRPHGWLCKEHENFDRKSDHEWS